MNRQTLSQPIFLVALAIMIILLPGLSVAKENNLGTFGSWRTYRYDEGGQTVCYMATQKTIKSTVLKKRGSPYLMITHRPIEASTDVVSYGAGVTLDGKRGAQLKIGKTTAFDLFSVRDTAWSRDALTDHKIVAALAKVPTAQLSGMTMVKKKKVNLVDSFDLSGFAKAYHAIGKACGLPGYNEPVKTKKKPKIKAKQNTSK